MFFITDLLSLSFLHKIPFCSPPPPQYPMISMLSPLWAFLFALVPIFAQSQLTINTPSNVVVCQPTLIDWSGGTPPYHLSILPGNQPSAPAIEDLGDHYGTSYTWVDDLEPGTSVMLALRDSTGAVAQTAPFTINSGSDTSCIKHQ